MTFRKFDLRVSYPDRLVKQLAFVYPTLFRDKKVSASFLATLKKRFTAGIPFGYIESTWADYQASDADALQKAHSCVDGIETRITTGSGILIVGGNGAGKSFLSYMLAIEAMNANVPCVCFSIWEYLEKRKYQYVTAEPFDELLHKIDEARVVVLDNLSRESENIVWKAEDLLEIIERTMTGGNRCLILNTSLDHESFVKQAGASAFSRLFAFDVIALANSDFRKEAIDIAEIDQTRKQEGVVATCYRRTRLSSETGREAIKFPVACMTCAYRSRAQLCSKRIRGEWKKRARTKSDSHAST